jgi:hypothetical protein
MLIRKVYYKIIHWGLFLFFSLLSSCIQNIDMRGLTEEDMVDILLDMHYAEVYIDDLHMRDPDSSQALFMEFEKEIYRRHGVDSTTFNQVLQDYVRYPDDYNRLYETIDAEVEKNRPNLNPYKAE